MVRLFCILILVLVPTIIRADTFGQEFDARRLVFHEKRYIQAALAWSGTYVGKLDGAWGRGSQAALAQELSHLAPSEITFGDLRPLLVRFRRELVEQDWQPLNFENDISYITPRALLHFRESDAHATLASVDGDLLIRELAEPPGKTRAQHLWLIDNHVDQEPAYKSWTAQRLVTSARISDEKSAYLISYPREGFYRSTLVQFTDQYRGRANLVIASISPGRQSTPELPRNGILNALLVPSPPVVSQPEENAARRAIPAPAEQVRGNGTGFYINATDIVTAAHVIDTCSALALEDGTPLTILASDSALDLGVLASVQRSPHFLSLSDATSARLGEKVFALGYPYRGLFGQGLTVTGGNLSALPSSEDIARNLMFSAPIQPGNSGGPLLNRLGQVIGVIVSRANDLKVLGATGTLPQNMNFAVSIGPLEAFLKSANIVYPIGGGTHGSIEDGVPTSVQNAIVSILCY